jgi:hypothetical protein
MQQANPSAADVSKQAAAKKKKQPVAKTAAELLYPSAAASDPVSGSN